MTPSLQLLKMYDTVAPVLGQNGGQRRCPVPSMNPSGSAAFQFAGVTAIPGRQDACAPRKPHGISDRRYIRVALSFEAVPAKPGLSTHLHGLVDLGQFSYAF